MDSMTIKTALAARTYLYRIFQKTFGDDPAEEFLDVLFSETTDEALACFEGSDASAYEHALAAFARCKAAYESDREAFASTAKRDYTRLLVGPHELKAPPWECVYLTNERVLFQEATLKVREAYRSENMLPSQYPHVSDDHIAIELDFMVKLSEKTLDAFDADQVEEYRRLLEVQRVFVREHPLVWVDRYAADMRDAAPESLHGCMAGLCAAFLPIDIEVIGELLEDGANS